MYIDDLIAIRKDNEFDRVALRVFKNQASFNPVYSNFIKLIGCEPKHIEAVEQIPFLPVSLFKSQIIQTNNWEAEIIFRSSTTTGSKPSKHYIKELEDYYKICEDSFKTSFQADPSHFVWVGLLPSYLEREDASLVYMVKNFMEKSRYQDEHLFFLEDFKSLYDQLLLLKEEDKPVILIGVTFALLDFADQYTAQFPNMTIIETGGMKGRGEEPLRKYIHDRLQESFSPGRISSEYGMTELMSQSYFSNNYFHPPRTLKVMPRDITDPFSVGKYGKSACLNIIDLGNINSCSFLATDDIGIVEKDGKFQVLGRLDNADVRGCSLMYA